MSVTAYKNNEKVYFPITQPTAVASVIRRREECQLDFVKFLSKNLVCFTQNRIENGVAEFEVPIQDLTDHLNEGETLETLIANQATIIVEAVVNGKHISLSGSDLQYEMRGPLHLKKIVILPQYWRTSSFLGE